MLDSLGVASGVWRQPGGCWLGDPPGLLSWLFEPIGFSLREESFLTVTNPHLAPQEDLGGVSDRWQFTPTVALAAKGTNSWTVCFSLSRRKDCTVRNGNLLNVLLKSSLPTPSATLFFAELLGIIAFLVPQKCDYMKTVGKYRILKGLGKKLKTNPSLCSHVVTRPRLLWVITGVFLPGRSAGSGARSLVWRERVSCGGQLSLHPAGPSARRILEDKQCQVFCLGASFFNQGRVVETLFIYRKAILF